MKATLRIEASANKKKKKRELFHLLIFSSVPFKENNPNFNVQKYCIMGFGFGFGVERMQVIGLELG